MWCGRCQSEVAAEVSPDNQRVFCAACGSLLSTIDAFRPASVADKLGDRTKDARELLQRWSSGMAIDPFGPSVLANRSNLSTEASSAQDAKPTNPNASTGLSDSAIRTFTAIEDAAFRSSLPTASAFLPSDSSPPRIASPASISTPDGTAGTLDNRIAPVTSSPFAAATECFSPAVVPSSSPFVTSAPTVSPTTATPLNPPAATVPSSHFYRIDAAHPKSGLMNEAKVSSTMNPSSESPFASKVPPTEAETKRTRTWDPAVWRSDPSVSGGWSSMAGQLLAYAGVLGMTAGACMVVWSYFGGPANYAPTGWLLATAGQMLLFFGVVTLVSGGLEQTTEQVNKRIEQLGDHIIRIEQAAREMSMRGGSTPLAHFGHDQDSAMPLRSAASGYERSVVEE